MADTEPSIPAARRWPFSYAMALVASGVALALSLLLSRAIRPYAFSELFLAAVAFGAWFGGLRAGLVGAVASTAVSIYFGVPPFQPLSPENPGNVAQVLVFLLAAIVISALRGTLHAAGERAETSARAAERQQERLAFLAGASKVLGSSLEYETTLASVARLAVPFLADFCAVDILDETGAIRRLALEHVDPAMEAFIRELTARYPFHDAHPTMRVLREGTPELVPDVTDGLLERVARDGEHLVGYRRLGVRSAMAVPLLARGRTLGAISFLTTVSRRRYGSDDLALAEDLAARCASAIDNARLYRELEQELAERRRAEERLRESEEQLHLAFDAARMGTWSWDLETGRVRAEWGDLPARRAGRATFEGTYQEFLDRIDPGDRARLNETMARAIAEGGEYEIELRLPSPDGGVRWIASKGKAVCDASGTPVRVIGVPMDVTDRKRTAQRLAVQYETARILAEGAALEDVAPRILRAVCESLDWVYGALWRVDVEDDVLRCVESWNAPGVAVPRFDAASRGAAFPKGIGLPGRVWERGEPVWIEDVVHDPNFPRAAIAAKEGLHGAFGFPIRSGEETLGLLEFFSTSILPPDAELLAMIGTVGAQIGQFIQRRRAEQERARLLARVQAAHVEARAAERRSAFLAEASRLLSSSLEYPPDLDPLARLAVDRLADWCSVDILTSDGALEGVGAAHTVPEKTALLRGLLDRQPDRAFHAALSAGGAALVSVVAEGSLLGTASDPAWAALVRELEMRSFMLVPLVARGRTLGTIAFASATPGRFDAADLALAEDLAYRTALAVDNARLYHEAQEAGRRKDEFLAMLGHELRNPLAAIDASVAVLDRVSSQAEPAVHQREIIHRQTRHLVRLVDDLLDVSRVMTGKIALQREPVDLNALAGRCLESLQRRIDERGHVAVFTPADAPVVTRGDAVRLEQVVLNLIDNAIKYTPPGGRIELSTERVAAEAVLRVRDTGIGMTADLVPRVFDLFAQADRTLDRAEGGLGLGLTLVRRLVEQHDGTVAARSAGPERGSEFIVSLPLCSDEATPTRAMREREAAVAPVAPLRILLVEDNADAREALRMLLAVSGHRVDVAADGPSGIELARRVRPDVTLVDIGLPGIDGYEVARTLRAERGGTVRLIALTGYGQPEDRRRALEAGFDAHLVKPVEADALNRILAAATSAAA